MSVKSWGILGSQLRILTTAAVVFYHQAGIQHIDPKRTVTTDYLREGIK